jgi:hypothetical protein
VISKKQSCYLEWGNTDIPLSNISMETMTPFFTVMIILDSDDSP